MDVQGVFKNTKKMGTPLKDYLRRIPTNDLDEPIDYKNTNSMGAYIPKDLGRIADAMPEWEGTATTALELGDADVEHIRERHPGKPRLIRREVLKLWRSRRGAARSTPRELITAFHDAKLYDYCDIVCNVLGSSPDDELLVTLPPSSKKAKTETNDETLSPAPKKAKAEISLSATGPSHVIIDSDEIIDDTDTENDPFHWCSFIGQQDLSAPPSAMDSSGTYSAVFPCGVNLWKKREVTVAFTYESYKYFGKWRVNTKKILILANRWHEQQKEPNYIPRFVVCPDLDEADIIVELNEEHKNKSNCGNAGKAGSTDPTMWLDLSNKDDNYNEYLVVHEFGHALGLGHEHQRSDFRACVIPFLDETKMHESLGGRYNDWDTDGKLDVRSATEYDPESVMHYWFKKEWLKYGFDDRNNIETFFKVKILSEKTRKALLGVHNCSGLRMPTKPSTKDLDFVNEEYGKMQA